MTDRTFERAVRRIRKLYRAIETLEENTLRDRRVRRWYAAPLTWHDVYAWRSVQPESRSSQRRYRELTRQLAQASAIVKSTGRDPWDIDVRDDAQTFADLGYLPTDKNFCDCCEA